jgi:hypothetical protein
LSWGFGRGGYGCDGDRVRARRVRSVEASSQNGSNRGNPWTYSDNSYVQYKIFPRTTKNFAVGTVVLDARQSRDRGESKKADSCSWVAAAGAVLKVHRRAVADVAGVEAQGDIAR